MLAAKLSALSPLLRELNDVKRVRAAHFEGSLADHLFAEAWRQLVTDVAPAEVALSITGRALVATRLAGIDRVVLRGHGSSEADVAHLFEAAVRSLGEAIPAELRPKLLAAVAAASDISTAVPVVMPDFVAQLVRQPRAGATHPGKPRHMLEPAESHADHCLMVAVYGVLVSPRFGGDPTIAFLAGLCHHLFNGSLPDAGFNGDVVMQRAGLLDRITHAAFDKAFVGLAGHAKLTATVRDALAFTRQVEPPESRCFHAADVFDRVLEMDWFARAARFTLAEAVVGLDVVHAAPEQAFQRQALSEAGIWNEWPR